LKKCIISKKNVIVYVLDSFNDEVGSILVHHLNPGEYYGKVESFGNVYDTYLITAGSHQRALELVREIGRDNRVGRVEIATPGYVSR
jgi:hypothetical protein